MEQKKNKLMLPNNQENDTATLDEYKQKAEEATRKYRLGAQQIGICRPVPQPHIPEKNEFPKLSP